MSPSTTRKSNARQRIVETAERLFYAEGVRAVGIDRIIAEAGVAKMTLYNHFASKDDLILAVLEYREQKIDAMFADGIERHVAAGEKPLDAFFAVLKEWFESPGFRGCAFINASIELADCEHPGSQFSARHKQQFHAMIEEVIRETAGRKGAAAAPAVALLVEGAIVTAVMEQSSEPADVARQAALALVARARRK
ncbi:putative HTH-type transcriptional regulator YxaF [Maioricimonas rarisocia]|uniref:Putative HTH-type transcriptional regulator YxaF n=1 Tax=Maioricimonas rarisocia TaxID=2528026 RepID=A0A517ZEE2_9PLAN|nr:TetR/AcrR family transcriptional regulator [Maioricimonas rarisocia]QDU40853.1 putative HTH-type transcriptional regulator YxaF [Maioricimonas rarisocia]